VLDENAYHRLIAEAQEVALSMMPPQGIYSWRKPVTHAFKLYSVHGAAMNQYKLACQFGLRAWLVPIYFREDYEGMLSNV
jgi:hypothetical protein